MSYNPASYDKAVEDRMDARREDGEIRIRPVMPNTWGRVEIEEIELGGTPFSVLRTPLHDGVSQQFSLVTSLGSKILVATAYPDGYLREAQMPVMADPFEWRGMVDRIKNHLE